MRRQQRLRFERFGKIAGIQATRELKQSARWLAMAFTLAALLLAGCTDEGGKRRADIESANKATCRHMQEGSSAACRQAEETPAQACPSAIAPIASPHGRFPFSADSEFQARFVVAFVIARDGSVESARIAGTDWRPGPAIREGPKAYEDAVLASVSRWKYPPRDTPCRYELPFEVSMSDTETASPLPVDR